MSPGSRTSWTPRSPGSTRCRSSTPDDVAVLRVVAGHPGLSAADLTALAPGFRDAAPRLLALGLVTSSRFERADCWARTAAGAAVLRDAAGQA